MSPWRPPAAAASTPGRGDDPAPLDGLGALVTGASRGIGRAVALRLAAAGARVFLTARRLEQLVSVQQEIAALPAPEAPCMAADARDPAQVERVAAEAQRRLGGVDILVNNAGVGHYAPIDELDVQAWDEMIAVNLRAPFLFCRALLPAMRQRGRGHIVNISSILGVTAAPRFGGYCASKWGLVGFGEVLRQECEPHGVRVSTLCPAAVNTGFAGAAPRPWALQPEDVAAAVFFAVTAPPGVDVNQIILRPRTPA